MFEKMREEKKNFLKKFRNWLQAPPNYPPRTPKKIKLSVDSILMKKRLGQLFLN